MRKWKTKNGFEVFRIISGRSNVYLISTPKGDILVDTGWKFSFDGLQKKIIAMALLQPVSFLILTHTHFDHCYNAHLIRQQENCKILMSEREEAYTQCGYTPIPSGTLAITKILSRFGKVIGQKWFGYPPFHPDQLIKDELDLSPEGYGVKIISTPGHSTGSISVIIDHEIAVVGDTMLGIFRKSIFPPFADDVNEMILSWGKLLKTECQIFLPGHGGAVTRDLLQREYENYNRKWDIL